MVRMAADSRQRRVVVNPESQWITHVDESPRIVWTRYGMPCDGARTSNTSGSANESRRASRQREPSIPAVSGHYLFSGLLRCSECGGNYTLLNNRTYSCAGYLNGRVCSNNRHRASSLRSSVPCGPCQVRRTWVFSPSASAIDIESTGVKNLALKAWPNRATSTAMKVATAAQSTPHLVITPINRPILSVRRTL
jgi:hypothetical protein